MSDSVQPHGLQPTRVPRPWDSPGKNTGVGCHFLIQCMKVKSESEVAHSCPTLRNPMDCSLPGSSVHAIFQARVLEWGAIAFSEAWLRVIIFLLDLFFQVVCILKSGVSVLCSHLRSPTLEKAMAPHSSTLAWKIPWMEEPGRLQSMGLRRVGHDCETSFKSS